MHNLIYSSELIVCLSRCGIITVFLMEVEVVLLFEFKIKLVSFSYSRNLLKQSNFLLKIGCLSKSMVLDFMLCLGFVRFSSLREFV